MPPIQRAERAATRSSSNGSRRPPFEAQLREFLSDLARRDATRPLNGLAEKATKEWATAKATILPVLEQASQEIVATGRRAWVEETSEGRIRWHVQLHDAKTLASFELGHAVREEIIYVTLEAPKEPPRMWPITVVTPSWCGDLVLRLLIHLAYPTKGVRA